MTGQHGYPRPQLQRPRWESLNGRWDFAIDPDGAIEVPDAVVWNASITVPFAPETSASGIGDTGFYRRCWYRRRFAAPARAPGERLLLHVGAVDHAATVWLNGRLAARHEGGYTPFSADVTPLLHGDGPQTLVVRADDDPHDLAKPRGKQDWQAEPHAIWYPRTTGIWQTVWLEVVPPWSIADLHWTATVEHWAIDLAATMDGPPRGDLRLRVRLQTADRLLADDTYLATEGEIQRTIGLVDPGIDNARRALLWSPEQPTLIQAELHLLDADQRVLDTVTSYTAMRTVSADGDRFLLNGRPYFLRLLLDQGYWPHSGLSAPDDATLRHDVDLAKALGFNGVRKHQKIEDPRFLYWADTLGLLVWEELPSAYRFTPTAVRRSTSEWIAAILRDRSHPCIVAWVPFNESWGVPDLPTSQAQRDYVQALYHLTRTLDASRPVIGNDGWEFVTADLVGIHDYDADVERLARRYTAADGAAGLLARERPGRRRLALDGHPYAGQPIVLSECGGLALGGPQHADGSWGYTWAATPDAFAQRYQALMATLHALPLLAGFAYTQFTDTYQEVNGLVTADRTPKAPIETIAQATRGPRR